MQDRFKNLIVMNTAISVGETASDGFYQWRDFCANVPEIPVGGLFACDAGSAVSVMDVIAYDAPFPDNSYKAGVRRFPAMVPVEPTMDGVEHGKRAREFWSKDWNGQSFMAIGMKDTALGEGPMEYLRSFIKGCPEPLKIAEAGHFVQEYGVEIAEKALVHFEMNNK